MYYQPQLVIAGFQPSTVPFLWAITAIQRPKTPLPWNRSTQRVNEQQRSVHATPITLGPLAEIGSMTGVIKKKPTKVALKMGPPGVMGCPPMKMKL